MNMLIDFLTIPLRTIDSLATVPYIRAVNYYLPVHIALCGAGCWLVFAVAASFGG